MFDELMPGELDGLDGGEGLEPAVLDPGGELSEAEGLTAAEQEASDALDLSELRQQLEAYALDDAEALEALSMGTEDEDGADAEALLSAEGGSSCGRGNGCMGSSWCYGCGDLK